MIIPKKPSTTNSAESTTIKQDSNAVEKFNKIPENSVVTINNVLFRIHKRTRKDLVLRILK